MKNVVFICFFTRIIVTLQWFFDINVKQKQKNYEKVHC